jgi:hypothetical protein
MIVCTIFVQFQKIILIDEELKQETELYIYDEELVSIWKYIFFRVSTTYEIKNKKYEQY